MILGEILQSLSFYTLLHYCRYIEAVFNFFSWFRHKFKKKEIQYNSSPVEKEDSATIKMKVLHTANTLCSLYLPWMSSLFFPFSSPPEGLRKKEHRFRGMHEARTGQADQTMYSTVSTLYSIVSLQFQSVGNRCSATGYFELLVPG